MTPAEIIAETIAETRQRLLWLRTFRAGIAATYPECAEREKITNAADIVIDVVEKQLATIERMAASPNYQPTGSQ